MKHTTLKAKRTLIFLSVMISVGQSFGVSLEALKTAYRERHKELRSLLLSVQGNYESAAQIVEINKQIRNLEEEAGITDLQQEMGQLRLESCKIQQDNPAAKKIVKEIEKISQKIKAVTKSERAEIDNLANSSETIDSDDKQKSQEARIREIEKGMKEKTSTYQKELRTLNNKLYKLPQIRQKLDEAADISEELKQKYTALKNSIDPLDEKLSTHIKAIHKRMESSKDKLKKLRLDIHKIRKYISQQDPCFAARESIRRQRWENLFA